MSPNTLHNIMFLIAHSLVTRGITWMTLMTASDITAAERYITKVDRSFATCGRVIKDLTPCPIEEEWYCQSIIDEMTFSWSEWSLISRLLLRSMPVKKWIRWWLLGVMITNACGLPGPCDTNEDVNVVRFWARHFTQLQQKLRWSFWSSDFY